MPPNQYSKLENIIILACVPYKATKEIDHVLEYFVEEINSLYINDITIKNKLIRFKMIGLVGDNLGQHQILGFTQSFRANHYCIRCKAHRDTCQKMCKLDVGLLRNDENYEEDVRINDISQTGVARNCVLNKVYDYNVTNDIIFDIMHDLLEGLCNFGMCGVLKNIIKLPGINLNVINNRLECFDFGAHANRPILLDANKIDKMDLGMSASEMCNLVIYFSLIIGDLVPIDTPVWEYYLTLQLILDILLAKSITHQTISYLESLITIHHSLYLEHFGLLKPKCHNMLHYAECLRRFGPLSHNWSMRFESMHYRAKLYAEVVRSRVNISKSMILRHNYTVAYECLRKKDNFSVVEASSTPCGDAELAQCFKWVVVAGRKFKVGSLIAFKAEGDLPVFGFIKMIVIDLNAPYFMVDLVSVIGAYSHMYCYVCDTSGVGYKVVGATECSAPLVYKTEGELMYISSFGL